LPVLLDCKLIFAYAIGSSTSTKIKPVRNWILKNSWLIMNAGKFIKSRAYSIYSHNPIYLFLKLSYKLVHNLVSNLDICHPIQNPIKGVIIAKIISFILFLFFVKNYSLYISIANTIKYKTQAIKDVSSAIFLLIFILFLFLY